MMNSFGALPREMRCALTMQPDVDITSEQLHSQCTSHLARFKAPKEFIIVDQVRRLGNGKPDYRWAKATAVQEASLT